MMKLPNRRSFLLASTAAAVAPSRLAYSADGNAKPFSFVLLGDLHYDKLVHHDFDWLDKKHPGDLIQIRNYSRVTAEIMPLLFDSVQKSIFETQAEFVLQVGDLVEGLCGNERLSLIQNQEVLEFVGSKKLDVPFLVTKGNHDVTGDGATEAFNEVFTVSR